MQSERPSTQLGVTLGDDVLQKLSATGDSHEQQIWTQERDLLGCIVLNKKEDGVHLAITVYTKPYPEDVEAPTTCLPGSSSEKIVLGATAAQNLLEDVQREGHTESEADVQRQASNKTAQQQTDSVVQKCVSQQTLHKTVQEIDSQTDCHEYKDMLVQTDCKSFKESKMQTDEKILQEICTQTTTKQFTDKLSQWEWTHCREQGFQTNTPELKDKSLQVMCQVQESFAQTDHKPLKDVLVQTELEQKQCETQTTILTYEECEVQASVAIKDNGAQTIIKEFNESAVQTELKTDQKGVQTTGPSLKHASSETSPVIVLDPEEQIEMTTQTDFMRVIDPSLDREISVQTDGGKVIYPELMISENCQTDEVKVVTLETQVENASQSDFVFVSNPENLYENSVQTDEVNILDPENQIHQETQTNLVWVVGLQQNETKETVGTEEVLDCVPDDQQQQLIPEQFDPAQFPEPDHPVQIQESPQIPKDPVIEEKWVQTDPVTIIIGDSSFLLQQLANINKTPEVTPTQLPYRKRANRSGGNTKRSETSPLLPENEAVQYAAAPQFENVSPTEIAVPDEERPRKGVRMLLPKKPAYSTPQSAQGNQYTQQGQPVPQMLPQSIPQVQAEAEPTISLPRTTPTNTAGFYEYAQTPYGAKPDSANEAKGKFNCPFCTNTYDDTPSLYKHIHEDHGTPRCSSRKARRKGTIIVDDDGGMHIVGEQNTLWELNDENMKRYRKAKRYQVRAPRYTPRSPAADISSEKLFKDDNTELQDPVSGDEQSGDENEVTLQIVQNGNKVPKALNSSPSAALGTDSSSTEPLPESGSAVKRAFNCPRCPRLFTKSSELYIHLQQSHKNMSKGRGRGKVMVQQVQHVEPEVGIQVLESDLDVQPTEELVENSEDVEEGTGEVEIRVQLPQLPQTPVQYATVNEVPLSPVKKKKVPTATLR